MRNLKIISPTRGENYTVAEAVEKILVRRNFQIHRLEKYDGPYSRGYSDYDGFLLLDVETLPSQWGPSIEARVQAYIPFHVTNAKAFQLGWSAYLYGEDVFPVRISTWLNNCVEARDEVEFYWDSGSEDPAQREVQDLIKKVAKRALVAFAMANLPAKGFYANYRTGEIEIPDLFDGLMS